ncbi:MAG: glycoside hydrolase family 3 protein [Treponema sp.]|nr:glycoside hydrolase family 3 protein [Candidatus Treponema equi]
MKNNRSILAAFFIFVLGNFSFAKVTWKDVTERYESLSEIEKVSQLFLVNIEGNKSYKAVEFLSDGTPVVPGGVLLFSYNIAESVEQLMDFTDSIGQYCIDSNIQRPYVAVDQEGGEVNRLGTITSTLRSCKRIRDNYSADDAKTIYTLQAQQMKLLGIHMNLAPVAEPQIDYNRDFLSRRSFGSAPDTMVYSIGCVRAYESQNIASTVKHFPGNSNTDPHVGLPIISLSQAEFDQYFLLPFAFVLNAANPTCVLMSHAIVEGYSEKVPACLSSFWINDVLKSKIGYEGLIISDDIFMGALADNGYPPEKAVVQAIEAGVDVLMLSEKKFLDAAYVLLKEGERRPDFMKKIDLAAKRVLKMKMEKIIDCPKNRSERIEEFLEIYGKGQKYER